MTINYVPQFIAPVADGSPPTTQSIENISGEAGPTALATEKGRFWSDLDEGDGFLDTTRMWLLRDRVRVSLACDAVSTTAAGFTSSISGFETETDGATWGIRSSDFCVFSSRGTMAIAGYTRTSDCQGEGVEVPIGVSAFVIADSATKSNAWCFYADMQVESAGLPGQYYGIEMALKNKGADYTSTPYTRNYGIKGLWLVGGGDSAYGGDAANPCDTAMVILKGAGEAIGGWNKGIIFDAAGLTGTDGSTGTGIAIEMAKGHTIQWLKPNGSIGLRIRSDNGNSDGAIGLIATGSEFDVQASSGKNMMRIIASTTPVNGAAVITSDTGTNPRIDAFGDDTNLSLVVRGKGSGGIILQDGGSTAKVQVNTTGIGFYAATPVAKPTVSGAKGSNAALGSLLTALSSLGLITDSTSA